MADKFLTRAEAKGRLQLHFVYSSRHIMFALQYPVFAESESKQSRDDFLNERRSEIAELLNNPGAGPKQSDTNQEQTEPNSNDIMTSRLRWHAYISVQGAPLNIAPELNAAYNLHLEPDNATLHATIAEIQGLSERIDKSINQKYYTPAIQKLAADKNFKIETVLVSIL